MNTGSTRTPFTETCGYDLFYVFTNTPYVFIYLFISLYVCDFAEERKLAMDEKPLLVQLNWHKDDREGRFLLRRLDDKTNVSIWSDVQKGNGNIFVFVRVIVT